MIRLRAIAVVCALAVLGGSGAARASTLLDSLVAYHPFTGHPNDLALPASNGTLQDGAAYGPDRNSVAGQAVALDGNNDRVSVASLGATGVSDFTVAAWFRLAAHNPVGRSYIIDLRGDGSIQSYSPALFIDNAGGGNATAGFYLQHTGSTATQLFYSPGNITGQWHHMVMVRSGSQLRAWFDGGAAPDLTGATDTNVMDWNHAWRMGSFAAQTTAGGEYWLNGGVDDVAVWNRALTNAEVSELYSTGIPLPAVPEPATGLALAAAAALGLARGRRFR